MRNYAAQTGAVTAVHRLPYGSDAEARSAWVSKARCRNIDPEELFVRGAAQREAATICRSCPVILECAADALDNRVEYGIWGGLTERQRRALLKQHPEVKSWAAYIAARRNHGTAAAPTGAASA
ncbi:MAG: WhiB family transcriptional regulator [Mycobacterium pseudokansasii]|uniref:WhiB family transcriptional regulator n=1 Tax=Mycobacterium pseudokansasii TaxID=2341080 RepID=UPI00068537F4|nr:WhiB family transcriptional regulator [Mycobacterium pseudokansasii]MBY0390455.1 WhiB family transcriptional regulator [Mycobacterium pseudokansasii]